MRHSLLLPALSLLALRVTAAEYSNPVVAGDWSDPGLIRVGADFYSVRSSFGWQPGLPVLHSRDLVHWRHIGYGLRTHPAIERGTTRGGVWGSDIGYNPNTHRFLIYAPIQNRLYAMAADEAGGPYTEPVDLGLRGIDPGFFADADGRLYLVWDWGKIVELTADGLSVKREVGNAGLGRGRDFEGPSLLKRGDWYYCVYSTGGTRPHQDSAINTARARRLEGPWERDPANPQLRAGDASGAAFQGPAHGTLVDTPAGEWFVAYHAYQLSHYSLGRSMLLEPVRWTDDGWWRPVHGRIPALRGTAPALAQMPYALASSDEFDAPKPGRQWFFHARPDESSWSLTARPGWFRAHPSADMPATTLLQSVREKAFEFETLLEFDPRGERDRAGLIVYHDPDMNFSFARLAQGIEIRKRSDGREAVVSSVPLSGKRVQLRIRVDGHECATFYYGPQWRQLPGQICFGDGGDPDLGWIGKDKRNTWTGTAFGMVAEGSTGADFAWFRVRRLDR